MNELVSAFGRNLRRLRTERNISQKDLADAVGVQQAIEPGQRTARCGAAPIAVVGVVKADGPRAVQRQGQRCPGLGLQRAHGQQQEKRAVGKGVVRWAQADTDTKLAARKHEEPVKVASTTR